MEQGEELVWELGMTEEFTEIVDICKEYSERLRERVLEENPSIDSEHYRLLFWPPWVEKLNTLIKRLEHTTPQAELVRLHLELMRIGMDYMMMDPSYPKSQKDADVAPKRRQEKQG